MVKFFSVTFASALAATFAIAGFAPVNAAPAFVPKMRNVKLYSAAGQSMKGLLAAATSAETISQVKPKADTKKEEIRSIGIYIYISSICHNMMSKKSKYDIDNVIDRFEIKFSNDEEFKEKVSESILSYIRDNKSENIKPNTNLSEYFCNKIRDDIDESVKFGEVWYEKNR